MDEIALVPRSSEGFSEVLDPRDQQELSDALQRFRSVLGGRRLWHMNSTANGGGVAELLSTHNDAR